MPWYSVLYRAKLKCSEDASRRTRCGGSGQKPGSRLERSTSPLPAADREGLRLAVVSGYSAQGTVNLLERWVELHREFVIHAETPPDELSQLAIEGLEGYFRSHPMPSERLAQANRVIAEDHLATDQPVKPFRVAYEVTSGPKQ